MSHAIIAEIGVGAHAVGPVSTFARSHVVIAVAVVAAVGRDRAGNDGAGRKTEQASCQVAAEIAIVLMIAIEALVLIVVPVVAVGAPIVALAGAGMSVAVVADILVLLLVIGMAHRHSSARRCNAGDRANSEECGGRDARDESFHWISFFECALPSTELTVKALSASFSIRGLGHKRRSERWVAKIKIKSL